MTLFTLLPLTGGVEDVRCTFFIFYFFWMREPKLSGLGS